MEKTRIPIFFDELKKKAQVRIIQEYIFSPAEQIVLSYTAQIKKIVVDKEPYGYDPEPSKQKLYQYVSVTTEKNTWALKWDCTKAEFVEIINE